MQTTQNMNFKMHVHLRNSIKEINKVSTLPTNTVSGISSVCVLPLPTVH